MNLMEVASNDIWLLTTLAEVFKRVELGGNENRFHPHFFSAFHVFQRAVSNENHLFRLNLKLSQNVLKDLFVRLPPSSGIGHQHCVEKLVYA